MSIISEEFLAARIGEVLEARLRKSDKYQQKMEDLHKASGVFSKAAGLPQKSWKLYDALDNAWTEYNIMYGEESYRLGFEDGMQVASEKEIRENGSVLSFKDMTHLVYLYDAVKKLNVFLLGEWDNYDRDSGILKELDRVYKVIEDGVCAEIRLRGEDELFECLTDILDNQKAVPEERARVLTGLEKIR